MIGKLKSFIDALVTVLPATYHDEAAPDHPDCYLVWQLDGSNSLYANNEVSESSAVLTLDFFTIQEFDPSVDALQALYNQEQVAWYLNSCQYEKDTGLTHWEWVIEIG